MSRTLRVGIAAVALGCLVLVTVPARADRVKLKDGRVIEGTVIPQGTGYWVKGADGQTYKLTKEEVVSIE